MKHWNDSVKGMVRKALSVLLISVSSVSGYAKDWIDVTDTYIKNPRFDNNYLGDWEVHTTRKKMLSTTRRITTRINTSTG